MSSYPWSPISQGEKRNGVLDNTHYFVGVVNPNPKGLG